MEGKEAKTASPFIVFVCFLHILSVVGLAFLYFTVIKTSNSNSAAYLDVKDENTKLSSELSKAIEENEKLLVESADLLDEIEALKSNLNDLVLADNSSNSVEHVYTQTFRYIEDYNYEGDSTSARFIIVDQFQMHNPTIITFDANRFAVEFISDHFYEITFRTFISSKGNSDKLEITKIVETDKVAFDQIQEPWYLP